MFQRISSANELEKLVVQIGFLPFLKNEIAGFSVEECTPRELWFVDNVEGPWEWKIPVVRGKQCVYGRLFPGRTGYVSLEWFPDLANYRRDGYDFDARCNDGLVSWKDRRVYGKLNAYESLQSKELKTLCGDLKGVDTSIARLQMQTYVTIADFEYPIGKNGKPYGWGITRYATLEHHLGDEIVASAYHNKPDASRNKISAYLEKLLPRASSDQLKRIVG